MTRDPDDRSLCARLRELSLVEPEALLAGAPADARRAVLEALADDLADALSAARARAAELERRLARAPEPLAALDASPAARAREGGAVMTRAAVGAASARGGACRELARIDGAAALVVPRLAEVERLLGAG